MLSEGREAVNQARPAVALIRAAVFIGAAVGLFASYLPARVAGRTDPSRVLYTE